MTVTVYHLHPFRNSGHSLSLWLCPPSTNTNTQAHSADDTRPTICTASGHCFPSLEVGPVVNSAALYHCLCRWNNVLYYGLHSGQLCCSVPSCAAAIVGHSIDSTVVPGTMILRYSAAVQNTKIYTGDSHAWRL